MINGFRLIPISQTTLTILLFAFLPHWYSQLYLNLFDPYLLNSGYVVLRRTEYDSLVRLQQ